MNKIIKYTLMIIAITLLSTGCGEGSNGTVMGEGSALNMELNTPYAIAPGDRLVPTEVSTIVVKHTLSDNTKTVQITSGSATLLKGDYVLQ